MSTHYFTLSTFIRLIAAHSIDFTSIISGARSRPGTLFRTFHKPLNPGTAEQCQAYSHSSENIINKSIAIFHSFCSTQFPTSLLKLVCLSLPELLSKSNSFSCQPRLFTLDMFIYNRYSNCHSDQYICSGSVPIAPKTAPGSLSNYIAIDTSLIF